MNRHIVIDVSDTCEQCEYITQEPSPAGCELFRRTFRGKYMNEGKIKPLKECREAALKYEREAKK